MITGYRAFLKSLTFPIQILVRSQQLDLKPYVQSLLESSTTTLQDATWRELALSHAQYVRELAARRTLLEHRFYVIIPSDQGSDTKQHALAGLLPFGNKGARNSAESSGKSAAATRPASRSHRAAACLARLAVPSPGRIRTRSLYYSCLTPDRALRYPLPPQAFASVDQPTRVKQHRTTRRASTVSCTWHRIPTSSGRATTTPGQDTPSSCARFATPGRFACSGQRRSDTRRHLS